MGGGGGWGGWGVGGGRLRRGVWYHPDTFGLEPPCKPTPQAHPKHPPAPPIGAERSFVRFVLEPLYKLTSTVISEHPKTVERTLGELGVSLRPSQYNQVREGCFMAAWGAPSGRGS